MSSTSWIRSLGLVLVVVVAGCGMPVGPQADGTTGSDEHSSTPAPTTQAPPVSTTQTSASTSTTSRAELTPPGVADGGLQNASALLGGHLASLRATGYRVDEIANDSQWTFVAASEYSSYRIIPGPTTSAPAVWANETVTVARLTDGNETVYQRPPRQWASEARMTGVETLRTLFNASSYTVAGVQPCGDRQCTVLRATGESRFETFDARALVAPDGVVHQFHATYARSSQNQGTGGEYHFVLSQRGNVTVQRPSWVETAIRHTDEA